MGNTDQDRKPPTGEPGEADKPGQDQTWNQDRPRDWERATTELERGDKTRPAQPDGTTPLERDMQQANQKR
jgi:hypothetical protein